jgi:murein DD-endopeptidase MepM/ murein hydrolase activator NlpD
MVFNIKIGHNSGILAIYAHLSAVLVRPGDVVDVGSKIGLAGNTGLSFGAHLHLTLKCKGKYVDPFPFFTSARMP